MSRRILTAREQYEMLSPWRVAAEETTKPQQLHRGIALRREDMSPDLVSQLETALNGKSADSSLAPNLLNHLNSKGGMGEWWTPDPKSAERFAATLNPQTYTPGGPKPHYQVVVSGDGDTSSAEPSMGKRYYRFRGGNGVNASSVRVRRQHPDDWLEIPGAAQTTASLAPWRVAAWQRPR